MNPNSETGHEATAPDDRRRFLTSVTTIAMAGGLTAGYGTFFALAGRYLYPVESDALAWQFVGQVDELRER